ncbi:AcrR family transcriptional regulator [Actinoalloteichus hoggarensis]|uniref:HTH-type transcriptional regulator EthR n=1 Tax=Actinoalloteichus hoggarensis TaxID=1470176 RepID=A0A221W1G2_9PSEU|nr:TetR/AcrR family transcriptional regulator [Actinoalloteichus hoggarensis]ASO19616.1 HTH-type transcriptional regulator EthR [Actinoalloteichus hoggarensis]MBB5919677.1 AcrR family transcriptional regulator [Actinoalloteichus hoggarensis]
MNSLTGLLSNAPLRSISIGDIAKGAGISRPSLYFYFDSKAQIFCALLARTRYHCPDDFPLLAADHASQVAAEVRSIVDQTVRSWQENTVILRRGFEAAEDLDVQRQWQQRLTGLVDFLADWIDRRRSAGLLATTEETPAELAESLIWLFEKSCYRLFSSHSTTSVEQDRRAAVLAGVGMRILGEMPARVVGDR